MNRMMALKYSDILSNAVAAGKPYGASSQADPAASRGTGTWSHIPDVLKGVARGIVKTPGSVLSFTAKAPYRARRLVDMLVNLNGAKYKDAKGFFGRWNKSKDINRGKLGSDVYTLAEGLDEAQEEQADKLGLAYKADFAGNSSSPYIRASKVLAESGGGIFGSLLLSAGSGALNSLNNSVQSTAKLPNWAKKVSDVATNAGTKLADNASGSYSNVLSNTVNQVKSVPSPVKDLGVAASTVFDTSYDTLNGIHN